MKRNTKGVWTAIKYKDEVVDQSLSETDPKKYRPTIYLWVRDTDLKRHRLAIKGFKPYFYTIPAVKSDANYIFQMPEIEKYELVEFGNRKLYRIYTYIPGFVPKIKRTIQAQFAQAAVREADVLFELRFLIDMGIRGAIDWYDESNPVPLEEDLNIPLRKIYIDTEVWSKRQVKPGRMRANEFIKCLTAYDSYEKIYYTWYLNEYDLKVQETDSWKIIWCRTVEEMMKGFLNYVKERDPDVITGYNVDFDLLNIRQEALRRGLHTEFNYLSALSDLGYSVGKVVTKKHRIRGVDWSREGLLLDGREVIDILDCIRMVARTQLRSYTLDYVVEVFLGKEEKKVTYQGKPIAPNIVKVWEEAPQVVLEYNKHDVELVVKLDEKNDLIGFLDQLRKTVGVRLEDAFSTQRMIDTEALRRRAFPLPSKFSNKKDEKQSYKGAIVVNPVIGLHKWVVCLDYKSLYPSIIRTFNIDTDTYVVDSKFIPKNAEVYKFSNLENTKSWIFLKKPRGLFPEMLDDFTALRDSLRKQIEIEKDPEKKKLLDVKQEVIKVLSNAVYGAFGYRSRKHNLEVAEAITAFGQRMIRLAADIATELGMQVIYGDTDSIFVCTGKNNYGEAYNEGIRLQDEIMRRIPKFTYQFNVDEKNIFEIKLEKIYSKFFMAKGATGKAAKKRYCGQIILKDGKTKLDVKGFDIKRSDTSEFASTLQQKLIETVLTEKSKEELIEEIANELNTIDKLPFEKIAIPSAISKPLRGGYKKNPIQKRAAENANKYLGTHYEYGSKPLRLYIQVPSLEEVYPRSHKKTEAERKELEKELKNLNVIAFDSSITLPEWIRVDYPRMLKLTVKPKIEKFLESLDITWEEVKQHLKPELQEKEKRKKKKEEPKTTLDLFFGGKECA